MNPAAIHAVVVSYNPDPPTLLALLARLAPQVTRIWLMDNASDNFFLVQNRLPNQVHLCRHLRNEGVALSYNRAIALARADGASHVVLFDQDSLPDQTMVMHLAQAMAQLSTAECPVAAVGPSYRDIKGSCGFFVRIGRFRLEHVYPKPGDEAVAVDHLISSGCLINIQVIDVIGGFAEELFIDYVDTEWCLRARRRGYALFGVSSAQMYHDLGDRLLRIWGRTIMLHSPLRHYYLMRNGIWLLKQPWVGWHWRLIDTIRLAKVFCALALFAPDRWRHIQAMISGVTDGLLGRMGARKPPNLTAA